MASSTKSGSRQRRKVAEESLKISLKYIIYRCALELESDPTFLNSLNGYRVEAQKARRRLRLAAPGDGSLNAVVRRTARAIEQRYNAERRGMCDRLVVRRDSIRSTFDDVTREIFRDGINYGRIASLFAFDGALAIHGVRMGIHDAPGLLSDWTADFVNAHLAEWIEANGGWDGFVAHFNKNPQVELSSWEKLVAVGGMVAGAAGLALVALKFS